MYVFRGWLKVNGFWLIKIWSLCATCKILFWCFYRRGLFAERGVGVFLFEAWQISSQLANKIIEDGQKHEKTANKNDNITRFLGFAMETFQPKYPPRNHSSPLSNDWFLKVGCHPGVVGHCFPTGQAQCEGTTVGGLWMKDLSGITKLSIWGGIKQSTCMVILRDFPEIVHCLGW